MRIPMTAGLIAGLLAAGPLPAQENAAEGQEPQQAQQPAEEAQPTQPADASTVLATVGDTEITLGHVIVMAERLPQQYQNAPNATLLPGIVEQLIDQTLLARQLSPDPSGDPLEVQLHLENERRGTLAGRYVESEVLNAVADEEIQAAYDSMTGAFEAQPEFNASHILVDSQEKAQELKTQLDEGADFAELAQANSSDGSAANGGSLGWFGLGRMVPEFEAAVSDMEVGAVSDPIETQFGWHLIRLDDKRMSSPPPLEEVSATLRQQVAQQKLQEKLQSLRTEADVEMSETRIDPDAIRNTGLLDQ